MESGQQLQHYQAGQSESAMPQAAPIAAGNTQEQTATSHLEKLLAFVQARPFVFMGGTWAVVMCVAAIALSGLLSPGMSGGHRATGAAVGTSNTSSAQTAKQNSRIPLWLFGAIALSCTAGSMIIAKQVTQPARKRVKSSVRPKSLHQLARPQRHPSARKAKSPSGAQPHSRPVRPLLPPARALPAIQPRPASPLAISLQPMMMAGPRPLAPPRSRSKALASKSAGVPPQPKRSSRRPPLAPPPRFAAKSPRGKGKPMKVKGKAIRPTKVAVTVVPAEEMHPLDWGGANLAEALDIRKQRSISSWL